MIIGDQDVILVLVERDGHPGKCSGTHPFEIAMNDGHSM